MISKFIDNKKIGGIIDSMQESLKLQGYINVLVNWAEKWQIKFRPDKGEVMHLGITNDALL